MAAYIFPLLYGLAGMLISPLLSAWILPEGPLGSHLSAALQRRVTKGLCFLLFFLCCCVCGPGIPCCLSCIFLSLLLAAALVDIGHLYIPDRIPCLIVLLSVVCLAAGSLPSKAADSPSFLTASFTGRLAGALACGSILLVLRGLTRGGVGLGDVKLMASCGLFLGPLLSLLALFGAYVLAALCFAAPLLLGRVKRKTPVPMAPFFFAALTISLLWGDRILIWYIRRFLLP